MKFHSLRRITSDSNHNGFPQVCWFQGAVYLSYLQGDHHADRRGRLLVRRSRDGGVTFDTVTAQRGCDLYTVGDERLIACGPPAGYGSGQGLSWSDDGLHWSPWQSCTGTEGWFFWRPRYVCGRHYSTAYNESKPGTSAVGWMESDNGVDWRLARIIHEGPDQPNEAYPWFAPDGSVVMLMRREHRSRRPLLVRSKPPYDRWDMTEIDLALAGPCVWMVDRDIYISGRWFLTPVISQTAIFKLEDDKPKLLFVMPSGPAFDHSYMGVAAHPRNSRRFLLAFYSNGVAKPDPTVDQWKKPDIYLADVVFDSPFIESWRVSNVFENHSLRTASPPDPADPAGGWQTLRPYSEDDADYLAREIGFVEASAIIAGRAGVIYFTTDMDVGPCDRGRLQLGYDGPVRVWVNGRPVFEGTGTNPAILDQSSIDVVFTHGINRIAIALDTNGGKACGIFARCDLLSGSQ